MWTMVHRSESGILKEMLKILSGTYNSPRGNFMSSRSGLRMQFLVQCYRGWVQGKVELARVSHDDCILMKPSHD